MSFDTILRKTSIFALTSAEVVHGPRDRPIPESPSLAVVRYDRLRRIRCFGSAPIADVEPLPNSGRFPPT